MAVTANQLIKRRDDGRASGPVAASVRLYEGTLVYITAAGYLTNVVASGANRFFGIATKDYDNSSGSAGDVFAECFTDGVFDLVGSGFAQTQAGEDIYGSDNFTITTTSTNMSYIGPCVEYVSATVLRVRLMPIHTP